MNFTFTECFGGHAHQTLYLCTGEPRTTWAPFPAMDKGLFHICVGTLYAKDIFREKQRKPKIYLGTVYRAAFRQPGDSALGVDGGGSAPTPPKCRPKGLGLRNVGLWASPGLRLMIAVGKY